jgi:hypothetical protein
MDQQVARLRRLRSHAYSNYITISGTAPCRDDGISARFPRLTRVFARVESPSRRETPRVDGGLPTGYLRLTEVTEPQDSAERTGGRPDTRRRIALDRILGAGYFRHVDEQARGAGVEESRRHRVCVEGWRLERADNRLPLLMPPSYHETSTRDEYLHRLIYAGIEGFFGASAEENLRAIRAGMHATEWQDHLDLLIGALYRDFSRSACEVRRALEEIEGMLFEDGEDLPGYEVAGGGESGGAVEVYHDEREVMEEEDRVPTYEDDRREAGSDDWDC